MFNYLGPQMGPSTVAGALPSGVPGTVPAAIPGVTPTNAVGSVTPTGSVLPSRPVLPPTAGPLPPALQQAIRPVSSPPAMPPKPAGPEDDKYEIKTQSDGSLAVHIVNANGTLGPIVKVIPPISRPHHAKSK